MSKQDTWSQTPCILYEGHCKANGYGYASFCGKVTTAHRVAWLKAGREVPVGMHLDHLCHDPNVCREGSLCPHRRCVNLDHLQVVTPAENHRRSLRDACKRGHSLTDPVNSYTNKHGQRKCRACVRMWANEYSRRRRKGLRLSPEAVRDIRRRVASGESQVHVAREYGKSEGLISLIVRRKAWATFGRSTAARFSSGTRSDAASARAIPGPPCPLPPGEAPRVTAKQPPKEET